MSIYLAVAKFEFLLQPVCSRAETLYPFGHLGPGAELGGWRGSGELWKLRKLTDCER